MKVATNQNPADLLCLADYYGAVDVLGNRWRGIAVLPHRNGCDDVEYARVLMVCGVLTIKLGNASQLAVQGAAKDMATQSIRLFGDDPERLAAHLWLGVIYFECGEYHEAIALADTLLEKETDIDVVVGATTLKAISFTALGQDEKAFHLLTSIEMLLDVVPALVQGKFYLNRGMAARRLRRTQDAIADYNKASELFESVSALRWEAAAVNNLAGVYTDHHQYMIAHGFAERAISLFQQLGDKAHEGMAWDQNAKVFLAEENFTNAERDARKAVSLLSDGDNQAWHAGVLITHGVALAGMSYQQSVGQLQKAVEICETIGSSKQASEAYSELWKLARQSRKMAHMIDQSAIPIERIVIRYVLAKHEGRITKAASELGIFHNALTRKIRQMGLPRNPKRKSPTRH